MNTCKTCKWWRPFNVSGASKIFGMGQCENDLLAGGGYPSPNGMHAGEVWSNPCSPMTGPEFGCVHHESKD